MADKVAGRTLLVDRIAAEMMNRGVFLQPWISHLVIAPPLIITREEVDTGIAALDAALVIADREADA
jgi:taurine--2-oxoglutarate transaminase